MAERKSILVITLSNIGDVILTTPVIRSLRSTFPDGRLTVVVGPKAADLLKGSRQIDRLLIYGKHALFSEKLALVRSLREEFYNYVVDLRNTALPFLVRAERRSPLFRPHRAQSAREYHLEVLQMMKLECRSTGRFDFFSQQEEQSLFEKLKRKGMNAMEGVVVAPGAGSEAKRWPIQGFAEVVRKILEVTPLTFFVVGDQSEFPLGESLSRIHPARVLNLAGELTLRELAALVSRARLVLTNDSACMHLGYELERPVVAVFGPSDYVRYGRQGPLWRIVRESPPSTIQDLSPEKVFHTCESLLNGSPIRQGN